MEVQSSLNSTNFTGITVTNTEGGGSNLSRAGIAFKAYDWVQSAIWHGRNMTDGNQGALVLGTNPNTSDLTVGGVVGRMYIVNNGFVGIGVSAPSEKLEVKTGNIFINGENRGLIVDSISKRVGFMKYSGHEAYIARVSGQDFGIVRTGGSNIEDGSSLTTDLYISANGEVGIGTTNPASKLTVVSNGTIAKFDSTASYSDIVFNNTSGTGGFLNFGGTTSFNVYVGGGAGGNLEMSLTNTGTLTVSGDVVAFGSPSDKRLKENIKPIKTALDKVTKLQGVSFDWKDKHDVLDREGNPVKLKKWKNDLGFIAQDVQKVVPELVRENENGMLSVRHQSITPILLEAIKELEARVKELENNCDCKK